MEKKATSMDASFKEIRLNLYGKVKQLQWMQVLKRYD